MGFPHQVLPTVALLDVASALAASLRLGLVPSPRLFGAAGQTSFLDRLFAGTTAPTLASQAANAVVANPRRLLFVMLATCVARCFVIVIVWSSVKVGIQAGRVGARSEDYSGRAIGYSAVCIVSILLNLGVLNVLFQSRSAPPDSRLMTVLLHMSASSLAGEQLLISALEWILFVVVVGTNGAYAGPDITAVDASADAQRAPMSSTTTPAAITQQATDEQVPVETRNKKDYGALTQSSAVDAPTAHPANGVAGASPDAPSSSSTSNEDSVEPSASSDIVDIPQDRRASMQDAKDRLQRARENGKVRRRSLWKKIRGKGKDGVEQDQ